MSDRLQVAVLMGSESDRDVMEACMQQLEKLGLQGELKVSSAHRMPEATREYIIEAEKRGASVFIAGAGMAAALPGFVASVTTLPVIGVPIPSGMPDGLDALLAIVQMPPGIPVATVAVGKAGAKNAAILAAEILAVSDPEVRDGIRRLRDSWKKS
ncbi:MAG TPA: 5-(carboxyamino)imidazole ribonucleotide mutase [Candidatus Krumholzibacterium sp.]|nr:5-(carboxyamino)imidazole ribonucleotide mutase [Candidatus Krumholzibacterium sp.]